MNNITKLEKLIQLLETKIQVFDKFNQEVSQSNVAWHIEHSLLTINGITDFLVQSNPNNYKWKFKFIRIVVMTMKKIPRGRGKSPKVVQPKDNLSKEHLLNHLLLTKNKIKELEHLSKDNYFEHPFFGKLKSKQTLDFLEIHTKHHLEIIEDIVS